MVDEVVSNLITYSNSIKLITLFIHSSVALVGGRGLRGGYGGRGLGGGLRKCSFYLPLDNEPAPCYTSGYR